MTNYFEVGNLHSYLVAQDWMNEFEKNKKGFRVLVGNKSGEYYYYLFFINYYFIN